MDGFRFDALARSLSNPGSRRRVVTALASGMLGLVGVRVDEATAKNCKKIKNTKKRKKCLAKAKPIATTPTTPTCTGNCAGKVCGDDGCGGVCGVPCPSTHTCQDGRCLCVPNCTGKNCGDDGCGGSCGPCNFGACGPSGVCDCGSQKEVCQGICVETCLAITETRNPGTCECCCKNGFRCDERETPCCSTGKYERCFGRGLCEECSFDAQCIEGAECEGGRCVDGPTLCP